MGAHHLGLEVGCPRLTLDSRYKTSDQEFDLDLDYLRACQEGTWEDSQRWIQPQNRFRIALLYLNSMDSETVVSLIPLARRRHALISKPKEFFWRGCAKLSKRCSNFQKARRNFPSAFTLPSRGSGMIVDLLATSRWG